MSPSVGRFPQSTLVKALVLESDAGRQNAIVSIDLIASVGDLFRYAYALACEKGLDCGALPYEAITFGASHSHSEPGAIGGGFLWSIAPATDLPVPSLRDSMAGSIATALIEA